MKTPIILNFVNIPEAIIGTFEVAEKVEHAIIAGELIFAPAYRDSQDGAKELMAISLIPKKRQVKRDSTDENILEAWIDEFQALDDARKPTCSCVPCFSMWLVTTKADDPAFRLFVADLIAKKLVPDVQIDQAAAYHSIDEAS